jgi:hypothetical protein
MDRVGGLDQGSVAQCDGWCQSNTRAASGGTSSGVER